MKIIVISDNTDTLEGMKLVGIDGILAHTPDEFQETFDKLISNEETGIIAITHKLRVTCGEVIEKHISSGKKPLVIEIPDRHGTGDGFSAISDNIKSITGISIE